MMVYGFLWLAGLALGAVVLFSLGLVVFGLLFRRRGALLVGGTVLGALVLLAGGFLLANYIWQRQPARTRAERFVTLPPEATDLRMNDDPEVNEVFFRLPETRSESAWRELIWSRNVPKATPDPEGLGKVATEPHRRSLWNGSGSYDLEYDPATKLWRYRMDLD